jgi:hypothetical protein
MIKKRLDETGEGKGREYISEVEGIRLVGWAKEKGYFWWLREWAEWSIL